MVVRSIGFSIGILIIFLTACGDDDLGFIDPGTSEVCRDSVIVTDNQIPFQVQLNGERWEADSLLRTGFQNNIFALEAVSTSQDDTVKHLLIQINEPGEGTNDFGFLTESRFLFQIRSNNVLLNEVAACGYVNISKLDLVGRSVSGTFQADINTFSENLADIDITDGIFNNLTLAPLLCEPEFMVTSANIDLFRSWQLFGIYDIEGPLVSYPVCDVATTVSFAESENNGNRIIRMEGSTGTNQYFSDVFNFTEKSFTTSDFRISTVPQLSYRFFFESQYAQLIDNASVTYSIEDNILIISNAQLGRELRFFALD